MAKSLGQVVRDAREAKFSELKYTGPMRKALAKKLRISPEYLGHIERDSHVRVSPRVIDALRKVLGKSVSSITEAMVERHNKRSAQWYAAYKKARA